MSIGEWCAVATLILSIIGGGGLIPFIIKISVSMNRLESVEKKVDSHGKSLTDHDRRITRLEPRHGT